MKVRFVHTFVNTVVCFQYVDFWPKILLFSTQTACYAIIKYSLKIKLFLMIKICEFLISNLFISFSVIIPERVLSYTAVDLTNVNVLLNSKDVSEYLKIAPSGLEVSTLNMIFKSTDI